MRSWFPPFANCAKDGAPSVLFVPARSKAWATRPFRFIRREQQVPHRAFSPVRNDKAFFVASGFILIASAFVPSAFVASTLSPFKKKLLCQFGLLHRLVVTSATALLLSHP
jgi:hypothetical protein